MASTANYAWVKPTVDADEDAWGTILNTALDAADASLKAVSDNGLPRGYMAGLALSAAGGTATFGIAVGTARDGANAAAMALLSAYTKTTSAWALGAAAGSLDTGAIANSTWYHAWLIRRSDTGVVDVLTSTSATAPTMPTNYDQKRRIGSMKTDGSAQWVKFSQKGDEFLWDAAVSDANAVALGTTAALVALTAPTGITVRALINVGIFNTGSGTTLLVTSPDQATQSATSPAGNVTVVAPVASTSGIASTTVRTNTSAQVRVVSGVAGSSLYIVTQGWFDRRGQDD